ncbi:MAG TPA: AarF/ABC1/UbiB kinase family protein [Candidatus Binataceae bacterium]|nr:AarF/ABC1/UbiB kinase family protein [Candidatus Binataceae bacterium]
MRTAKAAASSAGFAAGLLGGNAIGLVQGALGWEQSGAEGVAQRMAESLGNLKGLMMKMGQMASYIDVALPPEVQQVLATLQDMSAAMAPAVVERVIREELGGPPAKIFAAWEPEPFAAASIGQVHRARLQDGRNVAVKVQYPGIASTFKADLRNFALMQTLSGFLYRGMDTAGAVAELEERFMEECDYSAEARNQVQFQSILSGRSDAMVPEVSPEFSTKRVLTTEFISGKRFAEFTAGASQEARNRAAATIYEVGFDSIFRHRVLNCDPHPGNYLFLDDGRIAFLDFGCVKHFSPELISNWRSLIRAALEGNRREFDRVSEQMGFVGRREGYDFDYQWKMFNYFYRPLHQSRPFRFTHDYVSESFELVFSGNPNQFKQNVPKDFVFVNRLQWGLNSVLASLDAEIDARSIMLPLLYDEGETPPPAHAAG